MFLIPPPFPPTRGSFFYFCTGIKMIDISFLFPADPDSGCE